jgi:threonine synthase
VASGRAEVVTLSEEEIQEAWVDVARTGVFCEPASAAGVAALRKRGVEEGALVVCVLTGHGLKDPASTERIPERSTIVEPSLDDVLEALAR